MFLGSPPDNRYTLTSISDGRQGVKQTLDYMSVIVRQFKTDPSIRNLAVELVSHLNSKDFSGEVRALHVFVRDKIRYVQDIDGVETIQTPDVTLFVGAGDCDDKSTLLATLLACIGHPTRFHAIGFQYGTLDHVFVETKIGAKWIGLETTEDVEAGWTPSGFIESMIVNN